MDVVLDVAEFRFPLDSVKLFHSAHQGSDPSNFVAPLVEASGVCKLCQAGLLAQDGDSCPMDLQVKEVIDDVVATT